MARESTDRLELRLSELCELTGERYWGKNLAILPLLRAIIASKIARSASHKARGIFDDTFVSWARTLCIGPKSSAKPKSISRGIYTERHFYNEFGSVIRAKGWICFISKALGIVLSCVVNGSTTKEGW